MEREAFLCALLWVLGVCFLLQPTGFFCSFYLFGVLVWGFMLGTALHNVRCVLIFKIPPFLQSYGGQI